MGVCTLKEGMISLRKKHATVWKRRPPSENAWRDFPRACKLAKGQHWQSLKGRQRGGRARRDREGSRRAGMEAVDLGTLEQGVPCNQFGEHIRLCLFGPELEEGCRVGMLPSFTAGTMAAEFVVRRLGWPQQSWGARAPPSHVLWPLFAHSDSQLCQMMSRG